MASEGRKLNGFADALEGLDGAGWPVEGKRDKPRPDAEATREAAVLAGFHSRKGDKPAEAATPKAAAPKPLRRQRHLTGRSEQVNVRATAEVKALFQSIAEKHFPTDADAFEKAIELLEKSLAGRI